MITIHVHVQVKPGCAEDFKKATLVNARQSLLEPGVARFDLLQRLDDPNQFVLVEAYRTEDAIAAHKNSAHYPVWRETVEPMMAAHRQSQRFATVTG